MALKALDMFAGVGGVSYALRGYVEHVAFVEYEKDAMEFLNTFGLPVHDDITKFDAKPYKGKVDITLSGFPCTGFSTAGKGAGFANEGSGLFTEVVRVTVECEPNFVFMENSHTLAQVKNMRVIVNELDKIGYDCRWFTCHANDVNVGAHHARHRWFCLANKRGVEVKFDKIPVEKFDWNKNEPSHQVMTNSNENKRLIKFMGNSVVPDQVRYAFETIVDMKLEGKELAVKDELVKHGYSVNGQMFKMHKDQEMIEGLNIMLYPKEIPEKHNVPSEDNILKEPKKVNFYSTPMRGYFSGASGSRILTKRGSHTLTAQVKFEKGGEQKGYLSGKFTAHLMGYPPEYLKYLMDY